MGGNPHLHCELPDFKGYADFIFSLDLLDLGAAMAIQFVLCLSIADLGGGRGHSCIDKSCI